MDVLNQWVSQIIIFVLLATIIDLLIPATSMKKYIKFVVGLILILILLKPIFHLFDMNIRETIEASLAQLDQDQGELNKTEKLLKMQKKEIEASQDAYILEQMAVQLTDIAEKPLLKQHQAVIKTIDFEFNDSGDFNYDNLDEVIVYVEESADEEGSVKVVEDITINTNTPLNREEDEIGGEIKHLLQDVWEISGDKITVIWEGGTS
ncbi:MAG TPA: stage III sporulation protein AF [Bacillota bacterium]|nr:stage III sporulation protein AF [Bacillota bacterium]